MMDLRNVLILGGTSEARRLSEQLVQEQGLRVVLSLAGRTANPRKQAGEVRRGGFGGAQGLANYIRDNRIDILVDATHPFAARISENAAIAAEETAVPFVTLERPPWQAADGDRWLDAGDVAEAARLLGQRPRKVFLAIGRQELAPFAALPQHHYIVRSVDPVDPLVAPANAHFILERGPFGAAAEKTLFANHGVEIVVAKNSGGDATYGKIAAARSLGIPVILIRRPRAPARSSVATVKEAAERIRHLAIFPAERGE